MEVFPYSVTDPTMSKIQPGSIKMADLSFRAILICCEGKTAKNYFEILADIFRISYATAIEIVGEKGMYKSLIDKTVEERQKYAQEKELDIEEIECWAVCDCDKMPIKYHELREYAEKNNVKLAFAKPQFEAYLVQHFFQSKTAKKEELLNMISDISKKYGHDKKYVKDKANLSWMYNAILDDPGIVEIAIINSNLRNKPHDPIFLTVQNLTVFIVSLEPK